MTDSNDQGVGANQPQPGFLRSLFGSSRKDVWRELAKQMNGQFVDGGFWDNGKVVVNVGQWTLTLDTYVVSTGKSSTRFTRMRAPYVNKDGFRFTIYRAGIFSALGEMLGMQDIRIGDALFDKDFVIKGSDEAKVRALLADAEIRRLFEAQPQVHIEVKDDRGWFGGRFPEGVDELCFTAIGVIRDLDQLRNLFDLFAAILHQLCHIGSAYENDPGITG